MSVVRQDPVARPDVDTDADRVDRHRREAVLRQEATGPAPTAPGPRGNALPGYRTDHPAMVVRLQREYGDVVRLRIGPFLVHQVTHPDLIRHVLLDNPRNYRRGRFYEGFSAYFGRGLLTTDGEEWRRHRVVSRPVFQPERVESLGDVMTAAARDMVDRLRANAGGGRPFDVVPEAMRYAITVLGHGLFGTDLSGAAAQMSPAVQDGLGLIMQRMNPLNRAIPEWVPTRHNRRLAATRAPLWKILDEVIEDHRRTPGDDLVSHHLGHTRSGAGSGLRGQEVRDGLMTTFLAGHETTGTSLAWTLATVASHPLVRERLEAELDTVLRGRLPTVADLPRLVYTRMVVDECLRMYPPIWLYPRDAIADDIIGGYRIPAGSSVFISPYAVHRHPSLWNNPEAFDPERFHPDRVRQLPRYSYFPFGFGQRQCIGKHIALLQLQIGLAAIAQAVHLHLVPGNPVTYRARVSLRPRQAPLDGVLLTAHRRPE